jgi:hypothetical protein
MLESPTVARWMHEAAVCALRDYLKIQLQERFGALPASLCDRIDSLDDLARLQAAILQVVHISSLDELTLGPRETSLGNLP